MTYEEAPRMQLDPDSGRVTAAGKKRRGAFLLMVTANGESTFHQFDNRTEALEHAKQSIGRTVNAIALLYVRSSTLTLDIREELEGNSTR